MYFMPTVAYYYFYSFIKHIIFSVKKIFKF